MADIDYLRFYHQSEDSLKDKDLSKNLAFDTYRKNTAVLFAIPAAFQFAQIYLTNRKSQVALFKYVRHLKCLTLIGSFACVWNEKLTLEKKWQFYDRFYPEPTQLQRALTTEAQIYVEREARGMEDQTLQEKSYMDPATQKRYEQMYSLGPQKFPEGSYDVNAPGVKNHWGRS